MSNLSRPGVVMGFLIFAVVLSMLLTNYGSHAANDTTIKPTTIKPTTPKANPMGANAMGVNTTGATSKPAGNNNNIAISTTTTTTTKPSNPNSPKSKGQWEKTSLPPQKLCVPNDKPTHDACAKLSVAIVGVFHANESLKALTTGTCVYLTDGPPKNTPEDHNVIRCLITGTFDKNGAVEQCRLHFYNQDNSKSTEVLVQGYWGNEAVGSNNNTVATPVP